MEAEARLLELNPVVPVKQMQESLDFYVGRLGFVRVFDDRANDSEIITYAGVKRGSLCLHLQAMVPGQPEAMPLIRIRVENIEALYKEYEERGLIGKGGHLEAKPWGSKDFGVYDPNGAALVFYEDL